jgi:hypothetical protein
VSSLAFDLPGECSTPGGIETVIRTWIVNW